MARLRPRQYAAALWQATAGQTTAQAKAVIERFVQLLADRGSLHETAAIISAFERYDRQQRQAVLATATTAHELSPTARREIERVVAAQVPAAEAVDLETVVDPSVIGGVVVRINDTVYDGSLRRQVADLEHSFRT